MQKNVDSKIALVTGGTGFIGSNLVHHLLSEGWSVHCVVRPSSDLSILEGILDQVTLYQHDGTTAEMFKIVEASQPTFVFHLGGLVLSQHEPENVEGLILSNVLFATQLVESMVNFEIPYLINTGTSTQHYENKQYSPVSLYSATKQAFEDILQYYLEVSALKSITLEVFNCYGENDPRSRLIHQFQATSKSQESLAMSPGEQLIDIVHVDDVVKAFLVASCVVRDQPTQKSVYSVSSGTPISLRKVAQVFEEVSGGTLKIEWGGRPYRSREVMVPWNLGKPLPGWSPKISLAEGFRKVLESSSSNRSPS